MPQENLRDLLINNNSKLDLDFISCGEEIANYTSEQLSSPHSCSRSRSRSRSSSRSSRSRSRSRSRSQSVHLELPLESSTNEYDAMYTKGREFDFYMAKQWCIKGNMMNERVQF